MITYESSFGAKHSSLLNEWDYNSNNISPFEIGETSEIKVNWKCLHKHIWNSSIHNRVTNKLGCPTCEVKEIERGKWWGGTVPFGYVLNETKLEIDQKNASYVRMIYDEIRNGKSTLDVFRTFQSLNVQTARGKNFQYSSLKNLVSNTHYVGFYIYKSRRDGLLHKGSSPQLVAFDDWMFANRKKTFSREVSRILQLTRKVD